MKSISPGVIVVCFNFDKSQILLHRRNDNRKWSLPGGRPDYGETFESCVRRETIEETGYDGIIKRVIGIYSDPSLFIFKYPDGNQCHAFAVAFELGDVQHITDVLEVDSLEVKWFYLDNLPEDIMPMHPIVIEDSIAANSVVIR